MSGAECIAFDLPGNLYMMQGAGNVVSVFSPSGVSLATIVSASLDFPTGIAIQGKG